MISCEEFIRNLIDTNLCTADALEKFMQGISAKERPATGEALAKHLVSAGLLTLYQADALLKRRFDLLSIGQYEILEQIGAGGMGAVYKARHRRMRRIVAIKMLLKRGNDWASNSKRFDREIHVLSSLQHPNIVTAYDADECDVGPFLVMEFVNGSDLDNLVRTQGTMDVADAVNCILQAAQGLSYAHSKDVIHRDIKPANLLRVHDELSIKIADLGLARLRNHQHHSNSQSSLKTEVGQLVGTVAYMAPEQTLTVEAVDHRCDIYSLGCTLFFLLHGRPPYETTSTIDNLMMHRAGPIPSLQQARSDIPEALVAVFERMVAKNLAERFQAMSEVIAALRDLKLPPATEKRSLAPPCFLGAPSELTESHVPGHRAYADIAVLLIEPSSAQANLITSQLESLQVKNVQRLMKGIDALAAVRREPPDIILSAMHLDDMTGLSLARSIISEQGQQKIGFVLISSTNDFRKLREEAAKVGILVLAKPFDKQTLAAAMAIATNHARKTP